jgi:hypothetical protein
MRILFDNTIYEATSAHINAQNYFIFKTVTGDSYRLHISNKFDTDVIMRNLIKEGYVGLDNFVYVEETPAKLEPLGSMEKVKAQH